MKDQDSSVKRDLSIASQRYASEGDYWMNKLSGRLVKSFFPYDVNKPAHETQKVWDEVKFKFSDDMFARLMKLSNGFDYTLHMIFTAAVVVLLHKYSQDENRDIIVGAPIYKQDSDEEFINTVLAVRSQLGEDMTCKELLLDVRQTIMEADENQNYPLETLLYHLDLPGPDGHFPLFDAAVLLDTIHERKYLSDIALNMVFFFTRKNDAIAGTLEYNPTLYHKTTVERIMNHFLMVQQQMLDDIDGKISAVHLLTGKEKRQLLEEFNNTALAYPKHKTLIDLFADQVERTPDGVSLVGSWQLAVGKGKRVGEVVQLTYKQLNQKSDQLTYMLKEKGVLADDIVAVLMGRSVEMIIGIMGIIKAGGAYLPMDPDFTRERIDYILKDSRARVLVSELSEVSKVSEGTEVITHLTHPTQLCYVLYTSGSTGEPKAAVIRHGNVHHLISGLDRCIYRQYGGGLKVALVSPYYFDASVKQIFGALLLGHCLHIVPENVRVDGGLLMDYFALYCIDVSDGTPTHLRLLLESCMTDTFPFFVRHFIIGGEALPKKVVEDFFDRFDVKTPKITNIYGVTECAVDSTFYEITGENLHAYETFPIGKPMPNSAVYILDRENRLQPVGIAGELCIAGDGVGQGYLNRPELTNEKFCGGPGGGFSKEPPGRRRHYKTGDLARWLADGNIEFAGRIDHQVKIRGYRLELGEIENRLLRYEKLKDAVVAARADRNGDSFLCAYVVWKMGKGDAAELRAYLSGFIPDYMIPAYFIDLEGVPLTANGKVNRRALPEPEIAVQGVYTAPRDSVEEKLVEIWSGLLDIGCDRISIDANFFELGGHSLKATILIARIHKFFDVKIALAEMFKTPSIRGLAGVIREGGKAKHMLIPLVEKKEYYPLSPAMKRLYVEQRLSPGNTNYNITMAAWLEGSLDGKRLERTFNSLIQRHETLRTSFVPVDDEPVQRVHDNVEFAIEEKEEKGTDENLAEILPTADCQLPTDFVRPFDLSCVPLFRVLLIKVAAERHILVVGVHHMVSDGSSVGLLLKECMALYDGEGLPGLRIQYKDYSAWKLDTEHRALIAKQEEYWLEQFKEEVPVLNLPYDYDRPAVKSSEGLAVNLPLGIEESRGLKQLALREGTTLYMVLAAVFNVLLAKLTGVEDIVMGTPAAGRSHTDLEPLMGMFVNTLVLRNYPLGARTFKDFLGEVKQRILTVFTNQEYNFEDLVRQVVSTRDVSRNPIFDVFFALQNMEIPEVQISGLHLRPYNVERKVARFDLSVILTEAGTRLWIYAEYCIQLFRRETVERFIEFFRKIAVSVVKDPMQKISDLEIISGEEKQQILYHFNDVYSEYPGEKTIHELFGEQAEKRPDGAAVIGHGNISITYGELKRKSDQVACMLRERGVLADDIVAIMIERSIEMIIGIFGILKAGGAYLPIDPNYPPDRIDYMLKDSNAKILLTELPEGRGFHHSGTLAYVIYTSGTTGKPRAILTTHANVVRVVRNTNYIEFTEKDRVLQLSNYAFDGSVFDIYGALLNGAALVMVGEEELMALNRLGDLIRREAVTVFFVTTALFNALVDDNIKCLAYTRKILFGGERVSKDHARRALRYLGEDRVIHVYGPTETTVYASYYFINSIDEKRSTIPIGGPISNTTLYILDKYMNPVPPGIAGEIYIGGAGIARGYLNNPELTAEKFCLRRPGGRFLKKLPPWTSRKNFSLEESNDQCPMTNDRLYRTGDLACWLAGGVVEFIGRIDRQIKIRGFRVELGEIEGRLLKHDGVKEAVVLARGGSGADKFLCAYIVSAGIEARELKEFLSLELPGYLVPSYFVFLDKIPLTPNGKVDKRALPVPDSGAAKNKYTAPRDQVEEKLAEIWSGVFGISPIGIDDNFFELGGHSLKATLMVSRIHRVFHVNLPLVDFFKNPTIRQLANYTRKAGQEEGLIIRAAEKRDAYPLSAAQRRLFFLHWMNPHAVTYNVPIRLQLQGGIDIPLMEESFRKLVQRHDSLRTSFRVVDGDPVQVVHDEVGFSIEYFGLAAKDTKEFSLLRPFDLANAPLMRVGLIKTGEDEHVFIVDMHHIVSDGTSMLLLVSEFMTLYETGNDKKESLPEMRIRYKDYCLWQNSRNRREIIKKQEAYWLNRFKGKIEELELPMDYPRPEIKSNQGAYEGFEVDAGAARELRALAVKEDATMFMVILAVFDILLFKLSRQEDIVVGTANAGRVHQDLENIAGMFVNTLALRNHPKNEKSFIEFLREVGETTLEAFDNQDYQFEDLVEKVLEKRAPGRNPLFDVMFMFGKLDVIIDISQFSSVFINEIGTVEPGESSLKVKPYRSGNPPAKFDMLFTGTDTGEKLVFSIGYCTDLFRKETIERFITYFKEIVAEVKDNESILLKDISISHSLVTAKSDLYLDRESDFEF